MRAIVPYGSWSSPLSAARVADAAVRLSCPRADGGSAYWVEARPAEGGRHALVRRAPDGAVADAVPADFNVRSRVHEYGGGAYAVSGGTVYFVNLPDERIYRQRPGQGPRPMTAPGPTRFADLTVDTPRRRLLAVREELPTDGREPRSALVAVPLDADGEGPVRILTEAADFHASPRPAPDGKRLAWLEWDHPDMPWDATRLRVAEVGGDGRCGPPVTVVGGAHESVFQPEWGPDGWLYFVCDRTGWWNPYRWRDGQTEALAPLDAEFGLPQWLFGMSTYAVLADGSLVCAYTRDGTWRLARLHPARGSLQALDTPYTWITDLQSDGPTVLFTAAAPDTDTSVIRLHLAPHRLEALRSLPEAPLEADWIARPEPIAFRARDGAVAHAILYRPRNPQFAGPPDERPPLLVRCHGGPTAAATPALDLSVQYWTTRGFALLDVNYGGSTGYGRAYRERLAGRWGTVDVDDCVSAARYLVERAEVHPAALAIRGSSAGGFTVLAALAFRDTFRAGAAYYGVSDLETLARDTHKFESHYLERLVGPYPGAAEAYRARSPLQHADRITVPVIFFQGLDDRVVPPDQTERMVSALRARDVPVTYLSFPGEQHGFRQADTIRRCLEAELDFYRRTFGLASPEECDASR